MSEKEITIRDPLLPKQVYDLQKGLELLAIDLGCMDDQLMEAINSADAGLIELIKETDPQQLADFFNVEGKPELLMTILRRDETEGGKGFKIGISLSGTPLQYFRTILIGTIEREGRSTEVICMPTPSDINFRNIQNRVGEFKSIGEPFMHSALITQKLAPGQSLFEGQSGVPSILKKAGQTFKRVNTGDERLEFLSEAVRIITDTQGRIIACQY